MILENGNILQRLTSFALSNMYFTVSGLSGVGFDIVIAETNKVHAHICHISTETSVNMIRDAKKRGVNVTCEYPYSLYILALQHLLWLLVVLFQILLFHC